VASLPESLRTFANRRDGSTESVIIEVTSPKVSPPGQRPSGARRAKPASSPKEARSAYDQVYRAIKNLNLKAPPVRLEGVGSVVADVTAEQLLLIAEMPMVAAIRPNRLRHAPRPKTATAR